MPLLIGFGHQALFAVDVVGGSAVLPLPDGLGNPSPKGVMPVAGFDLRPALALLRAGIPDQPFGCVVFVFLALEHVAFLLRVPLRRVAHLCFHARITLKRRCEARGLFAAFLGKEFENDGACSCSFHWRVKHSYFCSVQVP